MWNILLWIAGVTSLVRGVVAYFTDGEDALLYITTALVFVNTARLNEIEGSKDE